MKLFRKIFISLFCISMFLTVPVNADFSLNREETPITATNTELSNFVTRLYEKILGRKPDKGGLNYWINQIATGKQSVLNVSTNGFFHSNEFLSKKLSNTEYVKICYRTYLGREYDSGGLKYWTKALLNGSSRDDILYGFAYSNEFAGIVKKFGIGVTTVNASTTNTSKISATNSTASSGIINIPSVGYTMKWLSSKKSADWQKIVDDKNTALFVKFLGKDMIADHASDGFKKMKNCKAGDLMYITKNGKTYTYQMTKKYSNAINTRNGIKVGNKYADRMSDGDLFAYCCNDATGTSVTVTFWKKK